MSQAGPSDPFAAPSNAAGRYVWAAGLGLIALVLNQLEISLLSEDTPDFLFLGGGLVLVSFVWLGPAAGAFSALVSVSLRLASLEPSGLASLGYVLEAWAAWRLSRRVNSLALGVLVYWLSLGWLVDLAVYGRLLGLPYNYMILLFTKQVFNGLVNALAAEILLYLLRLGPLASQGTRLPPVPFRQYAFSRTIFLAVLTSLTLGLIFVRFAYGARLKLQEAEADESAAETTGAIARYLRAGEASLRLLARRLEPALPALPPDAGAGLEGFLRERSEYLNVGVAAADGAVVAMRPSSDALGAPLPGGLSIAAREYFQRVRRSLRTEYAALILGRLHLRDPGAPEPIAIVVEPLLDRSGGFAGALFGALDAQALAGLLAPRAGQSLTLLDRNGTVIASSLSGRAPGTASESFLPERLPHGPPRHLSYWPPEPESVGPRLRRRLDRRRATYRPIAFSEWGVLVETPAQTLHTGLAEDCLRTLAVCLGGIFLVHTILVTVARRVGTSFELIGAASGGVAHGSPRAAAALAQMAESPILEVRELAAHFVGLQDSTATQREKAASALAERESRLAEVLEHSSNMFYSHTPDHQLTYVSPQSRSFLDCGPEEAMRRWTEFVTDNPVNQLGLLATQRALETGERQPPYELELRTATGRTLWVEVNETPVVKDGGVVAMVGALTDVSARKAAEAARARAEDELRQAQKLEAIGRLAGGIAHDFNNLLGVITGYADLLLRSLAGDEPRRKRVEEILRAAARAAALTRQLLAFSRRQVLAPQVLDLDQALRETAKMLRRLIGEDVELQLTTQGRPGRVRVDPGQLDQLVMNLAVNARDAMPRGGKLLLETAPALLAPDPDRDAEVPPGRYVVLTVQDTGCGMDDATLAHAFEPFFTTKEVGKGTGLGLATVYGVVKQSGGHIEVESELGRGSTFRIYFPEVEEPTAAEPSAPAAAPAASGETVLLVEDHDDLRVVTRAQVESLGYRVLEASGPDPALEIAARHSGPIHLLLTDVVMPGMSGPELAVRLLKMRPGMRVLYVSGYPDDSRHGHGALEAGAALLHKPFTHESLAGRLEELLHGTRPPDRAPTEAPASPPARGTSGGG